MEAARPRSTMQWLTWVICLSLAVVGLLAAFVLIPGYSDYKARQELVRTKGPLVEILVLATIESEKKVPRDAKSSDNPLPLSPACSFALTCGGEVQSYNIERDGTIRLVLSGRTNPGLTDKWISLAPRGTSDWHCTTNVPMHMFPNDDDKRLNFYWKVLGLPACNPAS